MFTDELEDLLTLLAMMIVADKKVLSEEIEVFMGTACSLEKELGLVPSLTTAKLLAWFHVNADKLRSLLSKAEFERELNSLFARLSSIPNKQPILDRMLEISAADDEFHVSEEALMVLAARYWNINLGSVDLMKP